jgi:hypothetical protein
MLLPAYFTIPIELYRDNNGLMAQATNEEAVPMMATSDSTFWVEAYGSSIQFNRNSKGEVVSLNYRGKTRPRVHNATESSRKQLFAHYVGEYVSEELNTCYILGIENGQLVLNHKSHGTIELENLWNDDFRGNRWFMNSVEFYRNKDGLVAGFLVSDNRSLL